MSESRGAVRERWRQRIAEHQAGGLSIAAFCRDQCLSENSFYLWRRRLGTIPSAPFIEVKTAHAETRPAVIDVCLGRHRLRVRPGFDRGLLIDLIRVLEGIP